MGSYQAVASRQPSILVWTRLLSLCQANWRRWRKHAVLSVHAEASVQGCRHVRIIFHRPSTAAAQMTRQLVTRLCRFRA